jgi:hypothetical protein
VPDGQSATETPPARPVVAASGADVPRERWRDWLLSPFLLAGVACVALAALSAAVQPTVPSYDPWAWIVWGREVVDPHLSFAVGGGPSWKPLPVIFTTVYGLFGGASPTLWVITARAGGLLALVAAYRLAARLVDREAGPPSWAPIAAGVIAAVCLVINRYWFYDLYRGTSEPILIAASLWAIDRHLDGRHGSAFVLGVVASLIRPEAWPFVIVYGGWLWVRAPRLRALVALGLFSIPFFWFVPPWIGSGQPFLAATHAKQYNGHLGKHPFLTVLSRGLDLQTVPVQLAALVTVGLAWRRGRERLTLVLAGGVVVWWVIVVGMTLDGYPGLERFYLPAAAVTCVLAGAGVVRIALLAGAAVGGAAPRATLVGAAVIAAVVAVCLPFTVSRIDVVQQERTAARAVTRLDQLSRAVAAVGGNRSVYPCRSSFVAVNHSVQTALAWKLHVTLGRVGTSMRHQGLMFVGPHDSIDGGPPGIQPRLTQRQLIASVGAWRVQRVTAPGASTRCVGT